MAQPKFYSKSIRLKSWDYRIPWWYFITICTKNHINHFGEIINGKMEVNVFGQYVQKCLIETPNHFPNTEIDYHVIMPNHVHFIIILNSTNAVEICHGKSLQQDERKFGKPLKNSLSTIINQYKGAVTRWAKQNDYTNFKWQKLFYDRIIRNEKELYQIRKYIQHNPLKFELDNGLDNLDI